MDLHALVIDADSQERCVLRLLLENHDWQVAEAGTLEDAIRHLGERAWFLVFCDASLSTQYTDTASNLTLLSELKQRSGVAAHIVITAAQGRPITALEAILNGAADYQRKPIKAEKVVECSRLVIERLRAAERESADRQSAAKRVTSDVGPTEPELIGESEAILEVYKELARIVCAARDCHPDGGKITDARLPSVFITGETGTGKELAARIIHHRGSQSNGRFIPVNCSNLSLDLAESELFGHVPGAFTGALKEKAGLWELADGGTLFLDEITEAPPSVLPKLLRVLQDGQVKRVGANSWKQTQVQVIAASNRDMRTEIGAGRFRPDLYHRLSLHKLHIAPLRERLQDIPLIVEHLARRHFKRQVRFSQEALDLLMRYSFPGNVRELENIVRKAGRRSPDGLVYAVDVAAYFEMIKAGPEHGQSELKALTAKSSANTMSVHAPLSDEGLDEQVQHFKVRVARETLSKCGGNVTQAAHALKISRPSLYRLIKERRAST
jgi:DNA-binding NtrC family response regulator